MTDFIQNDAPTNFEMEIVKNYISTLNETMTEKYAVVDYRVNQRIGNNQLQCIYQMRL